MTVLCRLADLEATGAKEVVIEDAGIAHPIFIVRHRGGIAAYFNACPHARLPLNAAPDVFLDFSRSFLFCTNHGAHFDPATGRCIRGPCKGESLKPLPIRLDGDLIVCTDTDYTLRGA
jgi:nitrite reductase/ring-hydroxylating ferredoxin subunit